MLHVPLKILVQETATAEQKYTEKQATRYSFAADQGFGYQTYFLSVNNILPTSAANQRFQREHLYKLHELAAPL